MNVVLNFVALLTPSIRDQVAAMMTIIAQKMVAVQKAIVFVVATAVLQVKSAVLMHVVLVTLHASKGYAVHQMSLRVVVLAVKRALHVSKGYAVHQVIHYAKVSVVMEPVIKVATVAKLLITISVAVNVALALPHVVITSAFHQIWLVSIMSLVLKRRLAAMYAVHKDNSVRIRNLALALVALMAKRPSSAGII
jgi:hypothetical protein